MLSSLSSGAHDATVLLLSLPLAVLILRTVTGLSSQVLPCAAFECLGHAYNDKTLQARPCLARS